MMMSALSPPAAATATTISVVLNMTNKEVESGKTYKRDHCDTINFQIASAGTTNIQIPILIRTLGPVG